MCTWVFYCSTYKYKWLGLFHLFLIFIFLWLLHWLFRAGGVKHFLHINGTDFTMGVGERMPPEDAPRRNRTCCLFWTKRHWYILLMSSGQKWFSQCAVFYGWKNWQHTPTETLLVKTNYRLGWPNVTTYENSSFWSC